MPPELSRFIAVQDPGALVAAAVLAFGASAAVFRLRHRMSDTRGLVRTAWIFLCGLEAGGAIWATHFIGLLSFHPGVASGFDALRVLLTLLVSVSAAALAFGVAWSGRETLRTVAGGLLLALAIGASHYLAASSEVMAATAVYSPLGIWLSVALALVLALSALGVGDAAAGWRHWLGAGLLAGAVTGLHLVAAAALTVVPVARVLPAGLIDAGVLALLVVTLGVLLTLVGVCAAYIDDTGSRAELNRRRRLADAAREGILVLDGEGAILDANTAFARMVGFTVAALQGRKLEEVVALPGGDITLDSGVEGSLRTAGGETFPVDIHAAALEPGGAGTLAVAVRDLREQREAERMIRHLADHDAMTGLANRTLLHRLIHQGIERGDDPTVMVICLNVDNSKEVNETLGHQAGDALLTKVATRLKRFEAEGLCTAGRVGGNEFAMVVTAAASREQGLIDASNMLNRLGRSLRRPFEFEGRSLEPRVSIGVAAYPYDAHASSDLLLHADLALKEARESGEPFCFFSRDYQDALTQRRELVSELRLALQRDELVVFYQPQAEAASGRICGFEALVRWRHPERGLLSPDRFVPLAEENGLVGALGEIVLRRACADATAWPASISVAVNLSALQLGDPGLVPLVHEVLIETGLAPARLELEITETALTRDFQAALDTLRRLKALGVRVAMDDFGTGYSSLSTLHSFPFDKIKVDKSFVDGLGKAERSTVIVRSVLGIGKGLGIPVVAEGVETPAQRDVLRAEGCAELQGYLIGRPAPVEAHAALLTTSRAPQAAAAA